MRVATIATLLSTVMAGLPGASIAKGLDVRTLRPAHQEGELRWRTSLRQRRDASCSDASKRDGVCPTTWYVYLRNDSFRPIQCEAAFDFAPARYPPLFRSARYLVLMPESEETLAEASEDITAAWRGHEFTCALVPAAVPTAPQSDAACKVELVPRAGDVHKKEKLEDFFPAGALRREESGEVIIDLSFRADSALQDVSVVRSSGFASLDNAALQIADHLSASAACAGQRLRRTVQFEKPVRRQVSPDFAFVDAAVHLIE